MANEHDHPHDGEHEILTYADPSRHDYDETAHYPLMVEAMRELLIEKGVTTAQEINAQIDTMDARTPANGAVVVARAWTDPDFRAALLEDASVATREMGFDIGPMRLIALENTPDIHNIVVCTLCSCYPRNLLGLPPDWYKSRAYRSRTVKEPRKVLAEFGVTVPTTTTVRVHDSTADMRYIVLPARPEGTEGWTEEQLAAIVTRDCMIGVAVPAVPG